MLLIATLPLVVAWYVAGDSGAAPREARAQEPAVPAQARRPAAAPARPRPAARRPATRRPTQAAIRRALFHPLIGMPRGRLIRTLGRPTSRSSEAGLALFEYHLPEADFQLVLVDRRVVEVNRIR